MINFGHIFMVKTKILYDCLNATNRYATFYDGYSSDFIAFFAIVSMSSWGNWSSSIARRPRAGQPFHAVG